MLSEKASHKKRNIVLFYLYKVPRVITIIETEGKWHLSGVCQHWRKEGIGSCC